MEAKLIWNSISKDTDGFPVTKENEKEVFAEEKEITRSEFYESMRSDIKVKKVIEIRIEDFELSKHVDEGGKTLYASEVKYDDETFKIIRTYKKGKAKIELTCGEM